MLLIAMDLSLILNCVQAVNVTKEKVYEIGYCDKVLKYKGIERGAVYVVYEENGEQYPAYCINPERIGVGETDSYEVSLEGYITDVILWRIITNGYPYKTVEALGVANEKEAYLATKQAIYCYLDNRNIEEYSGIGEAGERTLRALKQIWNNAQNSSETKISNTVDIIPVDSEWKQDNLNSQYISKTYKIKAPAPIVDYKIEIEGENLPNGLVVTTTSNDIQKIFSPFEEFKILIPINSLKSNGSFQINVETKMDTKPVLYGASKDSNLQDYALTTFFYEDSNGTYSEQYHKNEAKIKILKQEKETKNPLKGVEFELLNSDKEVIYQSLITNEKGEIVLKDIVPGKYYLKEIKTLPGYILYDEYIEIDINLNEQINVTVNNTKEKTTEIFKQVTNIEVGNTEENIKEIIDQTTINIAENETNIQKLPKTGM